MSPLSFRSLSNRNADGCVNTVNEKVTAATLVNFGPVTPEVLRRICMVVTARRLKYAVRWFLKDIR